MHCSNHNPDYANDDAKNGPSEGKFQIEKTALFTSKSFLRLSSQPTVGKLALWLRKKPVVNGIPNAFLAKFFKFRPPLGLIVRIGSHRGFSIAHNIPTARNDSEEATGGAGFGLGDAAAIRRA
jgi:hypothetical protein